MSATIINATDRFAARRAQIASSKLRSQLLRSVEPWDPAKRDYSRYDGVSWDMSDA